MMPSSCILFQEEERISHVAFEHQYDADDRLHSSVVVHTPFGQASVLIYMLDDVLITGESGVVWYSLMHNSYGSGDNE